jgi:hypothetical protein
MGKVKNLCLRIEAKIIKLFIKLLTNRDIK